MDWNGKSKRNNVLIIRIVHNRIWRKFVLTYAVDAVGGIGIGGFDEFGENTVFPVLYRSLTTHRIHDYPIRSVLVE